MNIKKTLTKVLKKDSIIAYEKWLEKLSKNDKEHNSFWFRYYYDFRTMTEEQKWKHYYQIVIKRTDLKPKYRAKALEYLCKK